MRYCQFFKYLIILLAFYCVTVFASSQQVIFGVAVSATTSKQQQQYILSRYRPLVKWLQRKTGWGIRLEGYQRYAELKKKLRSNYYAFAYTKVDVYRRIKRYNPQLTPLAVVVSKNYLGKESLYYNSAIFTSVKQMKIKKIQDLENKIFGFTSPYSESSFVKPVAYLAQNNIDYRHFFKRVIFFHQADALFNAVRSGEVAAGAIWRGEFRLMPKQKAKQFKVILDLPGLLNPMYAATAALNQKQKRKLKKILLQAPRKLFKDLDYQYLTKVPKGFYQHEL